MLRDRSHKRIQICFYGDNPDGIKIAESPNTAVQAVCIPRHMLKDVKDEELKKPTIYFLFGGDKQAYIGEAANGYERLKQHNKGKDFWDTAVMIVSRNSSIGELNKLDVQYLENKAYESALNAGTYKLNQTIPTEPAMDQFRKRELEGILENIKYFLSTYNFLLFDESSHIQNPSLEEKHVEAEPVIHTPIVKQSEVTVELKNEEDTVRLEETTLYLDRNDSKGTGKHMKEGFLIFKGSMLGKETNFPEELLASHMQRLTTLLAEGVVKEIEGRYVFTEDHLFNSNSGAANFVAQTRCSGPSVWRDKDGVMLKTLKEQLAQTV
ncbi:GIY-YIG nuclease family protein [Priestia endophytica]|uniref:GIY-YIG nuclease family protein n=1 Tax=Priestia endophytica TaxID=135735 RepID=UPI00155911BA|nr:GIY-YIG nuclease family protein [Priestia endophytica]